MPWREDGSEDNGAPGGSAPPLRTTSRIQTKVAIARWSVQGTMEKENLTGNFELTCQEYRLCHLACLDPPKSSAARGTMSLLAMASVSEHPTVATPCQTPYSRERVALRVPTRALRLRG